VQYLTCKDRTNIDCSVFDPFADGCLLVTSNTSGGGGVTTVSQIEEVPNSILDVISNPPPVNTRQVQTNFEGWKMGCAIYLDDETCYRCYAHKYLNPTSNEYNKVCLDVRKPIENCKFYSQSQQCEECKHGFLLVENECRLIKVKNCGTYLNENNCEICSKEFPFKDFDSNCSKHPSNQHCYIYSVNLAVSIAFEDLVPCDVCEQNYYPDDNHVCHVILAEDRKIRNCLYYLGRSLCKQCKVGYYLKFDGKLCLLNPEFDQNCLSFNYQTTCSVCREMFYIQNGNCLPC